MLLTSVQMLGLAVDRPGCMHQSVFFSDLFFFVSQNVSNKTEIAVD